MKYYTVEKTGMWFIEYRVKVFEDDSVLYYAKVDSANIEGYCQCLADFGYKYFENGVDHEQFI